MKKRTLAFLVLGTILLVIGGCIAGAIYTLVKVAQGPECTVENGFFVQRKHHFRFPVPSGWRVQDITCKDKDPVKLILRKNSQDSSSTASYLPAFASAYSSLSKQSLAALRAEMEKDVNELKEYPDVYKNLQIQSKDASPKGARFFIGTLSYKFTGAQNSQSQITEKRYYLRNGILIWWSLSDFESRFSNATLNQVANSVRFE